MEYQTNFCPMASGGSKSFLLQYIRGSVGFPLAASGYLGRGIGRIAGLDSAQLRLKETCLQVMKPRVALVTHDYFQSGGTRTMTRFLRDALEKSGSFAPTVISVATSKNDRNSVRFRHPSSWRKGILVTEESDEG